MIDTFFSSASVPTSDATSLISALSRSGWRCDVALLEERAHILDHLAGALVGDHDVVEDLARPRPGSDPGTR